MFRVAITIFIWLFSVSVLSAEDGAYKDTMRDFLEATGSIESTKSVVENSLMLQAQNLRNSQQDPELVDVVFDEIRKHYLENYLTEQYLLNLYEPSFRKHFSLVELQELVAFYRSPIGQKLASLQPAIAIEAMNNLQANLRAGEAQLQSKIRSRLAKEGLQ
ncbi:DUF2059 domain-containing protein [Shewanella gelidii]|uniref:DUF2059 domain-containing protein n=1 Tax=Shewanella gelidii TaxID=1642821 RepID=A0A917N6K2_9GAMM|nr:DUF2059 domain-containing protein [Shewanella gelidii]MCL1096948.1 DUF2059 domain-containing protein [Shewanella gelidii]GGI71443.1 hypothetical protein GCM10009332_05940 [Shewanella gelidii]